MSRDIKQRKLSILNSVKRPSRLLFLDTETKIRRAKLGGQTEVCLFGYQELFYGDNLEDITLHRFELGWTCFRRYVIGEGFTTNEWKLWQDTYSLANYIESLVPDRTTLHIFGANIFFDLQVSDFFYYFTRSGWVLDFLYDKGLTYILVIRKGTRCIKCVSTTNYFPVSVAVLGKFLNIPKLDVKFGQCSKEELISYCKRDVLIIMKAIEYYIAFIDKHKLGRFSLGRPAQALTAYRYRFMSKNIYIHKNSLIQELEKDGYFGGRVECRYLGKLPKDKYISLDVNSMYPFVMLKNKMPTKLLDYVEHYSISDLANLFNKYSLIAKVNLVTEEPVYAVKRGIKVIFPVGSFTTTLCSAGLKYAYKHNHLRSIDLIAIYEQDYIFTEYVRYFMRLKEKYSKEGNKFLREVSKYFLLYLYGKFAQQKDIIISSEDITFDGYSREEVLDIVTGKTEITTKLFNKMWVTYDREPASCCFMAIAAHVTEYARLHLYKLMRKVGIENVLYSDTDSLKLRKKHIKPLASMIDQHKLGKLKIEEEFTQFTINGAKNYSTENTHKIKGLPSQAKQIDEYTYAYTQFMKQATHLRLQVTRYLIAKDVTKTIKPFYDKGEVLEDGTIRPFNLL